MKHRHLVVFGGAHIDRRGRVSGPHMAEASNPGTMREEVGGGAFNAARAAARRGISVSLMSVRGGDAAGETVAEAVEAARIRDLSATFLDRTTPSYTAILTESGDLVTGLADMNLYEHAFPRLLVRRPIREAAAGAQAVLCDANMPAAAIARLVDLAKAGTVHAIAVSPAKVERLAGVLDRLAAAFMNRREACRLAGLPAQATSLEAAEALAQKGLAAGVITNGGEPALCFQDGLFLQIDPPPPAAIADVTGAGDALAGATVAAIMRGLAFADAVREGMAAARLAVESLQAAPPMDEAEFAATLAKVPPPRPAR